MSALSLDAHGPLRLRVLDGNLKWCYECQNAVIPEIVQGIWLCGPVSKFAEILTDYKEGATQCHATVTAV